MLFFLFCSYSLIYPIRCEQTEKSIKISIARKMTPIN